MANETLMDDGEETQKTVGQTAAESKASAAGEAQQSAAKPKASAEGEAQQKQPEGRDVEPRAGAAAPGEKPQGAPEKYEFKAPEGVAFDDAVIAAYSEAARELNLPQEAAQKVLDKVAPVLAARQIERIAAIQNEWVEASRADREFGGDKLESNLAVAKKALERFGTPELKKLLNESGMGNHPEVIRAFYRVGKAISEDRFVVGKAAPAEANDARSLYPNSNLR